MASFTALSHGYCDAHASLSFFKDPEKLELSDFGVVFRP